MWQEGEAGLKKRKSFPSSHSLVSPPHGFKYQLQQNDTPTCFSSLYFLSELHCGTPSIMMLLSPKSVFPKPASVVSSASVTGNSQVQDFCHLTRSSSFFTLCNDSGTILTDLGSMVSLPSFPSS